LFSKEANSLYLYLFFILYLSLPLYLIIKNKAGALLFFIFLGISCLIYLYFLQNYISKKRAILVEIESTQEQINNLNYKINQSKELKPRLSLRLTRYKQLRSIAEKINSELTSDYVINTLADVAFSMITDRKGIVCLYLIDPSEHKLQLATTRKPDESLVIKEKEGDIFDYWVVKHAQPLFIEDISKDFRFDIERLGLQETRKISSLIAAPLASEEKILGVLRLESTTPNCYTQDDLVFLSTLSDLGAIAIENAQLYARTKELALRDSLTSLYTRTYFMERLNEELQRTIRSGSSLSLLMLDIDHFKNYNDTYGHIAGDIILKTLGLILVDFFEKKNGIAARYGGEEFVVLLPDIKMKEALDLAEELRLTIANRKVILRRKETAVTVSIGVSTFSKDILDGQALIAKADSALYEAKQKGRNRVCYC